MLRQDGVGVDENLIVFLRHQFVLLLRSVVVTEEAGAFADCLLVYSGSSGDDSGGIKLSRHHHLAKGQFLCLYAFLQRFVSLSSLGPFLQFLLEESLKFFFRHLMLPEQVELLACFDLEGAQVVLVSVVLVDLVLTESGIAVAFPSTAKIQLVVDAADAVAAAYHQAKRIVFPIACVGYLKFTEYGCEEGAGSSESVDA